MTELPPEEPQADETAPERSDDVAYVPIQPAEGEPYVVEVHGTQVDGFLEVNDGASY